MAVQYSGCEMVIANSWVYRQNQEQNQSRKTRENCNLVRKACVKTELRKAWFLKRLDHLNRWGGVNASQHLFVSMRICVCSPESV